VNPTNAIFVSSQEELCFFYLLVSIVCVCCPYQKDERTELIRNQNEDIIVVIVVFVELAIQQMFLLFILNCSPCQPLQTGHHVVQIAGVAGNPTYHLAESLVIFCSERPVE